MSWVKIDDGLPGHHKVDQLLDEDELRGLAAIGLWAQALCIAGQQLSDGRISRRALRRIAPEHADDLVGRLLDVGLLDQDEDGLSVHDFLDYNWSAEKVELARQKNADKLRNWRDKQKPSNAAGNEVRNPVTDRVRNGTPSHPIPTPSDRKSLQVAHERARRPEGDPLHIKVWSILQGAVDGLTNDKDRKEPTPKAVLAVLQKHQPDDETALAAATATRSIAQSQDKAPNIVGLYAQQVVKHLAHPKRQAAGGSVMSEFALSFPAALVDAIAERVVELLDERHALAAQEPEPYVSVDEAAAWLGARPKGRIYDLVAEGKLRCVRDGRTVLTKRSWIDEYLASQEAGGEAQGRLPTPPLGSTGEGVSCRSHARRCEPWPTSTPPTPRDHDD